MPKELKICYDRNAGAPTPRCITSEKQCETLFGWEFLGFSHNPAMVIPLESGMSIERLEPGETITEWIPWALNLSVVSNKIIECEGGYVG